MTRGFMKWLVMVLVLSVLALAPPNVTNAVEVTFVRRVENGRVTENMRLIRVKQNDMVRLPWSTDKPSSLHLHGYDC
jgi:hypothetical protein